MKPTMLFLLSLVCAGGCAKTTLPSGKSGKCSPSSAPGKASSGFVGLASVRPANQSAPSFGLSSNADVPASAMLLPGGVIEISELPTGPDFGKNVGSTPTGKWVFNKKSRCSAVFDVRKIGENFEIDAFSSEACVVQRLIYSGSAQLALSLFAPGVAGAAGGFETINVSLPLLDTRDTFLKEMDGVPNSNVDMREQAIEFGFTTERLSNIRDDIAYEPLGGSKQLAQDLCAYVSPEEREIWQNLPAAQRETLQDPMLSSFPTPRNCQLLVEGAWYRFKVSAQEGNKNKDFLESMVLRSQEYFTERLKSAKFAAGLAGKFLNLREVQMQAQAAEQKYRRLRLALYVGQHDCVNGLGYESYFCGANQNKYLELVKRLVAPELSVQIDAHIASARSKETFEQITSVVITALDERTIAFVKYAKALQELQALMKVHREEVAIATSHIVNKEKNNVDVFFEALPLFPKTGGVDPALASHIFSFSKAFVEASFDVTKAHPLVNNLRNELQDGYAVTFFGYPVGALRVETSESGGSSLISLPGRRNGSSDAGASQNAEKNTDKSEAEKNTADGC